MKKNLIIIIVAGVILILITVVAYLFRPLRLVSVEPIPSEQSVSLDRAIRLTFNKKVNPKIVTIMVSPVLISQTLTQPQKNVIEVKHDKVLVKNSPYSVTISFTKPVYLPTQERKTQFRWSFKTGDRLTDQTDVVKATPNDPLAEVTPYYDPELRFAVLSLNEQKQYLVELYPILNRPEQREPAKKQLEEYKQAARDWIRSQGVDPNKITIVFEPDTIE